MSAFDSLRPAGTYSEPVTAYDREFEADAASLDQVQPVNAVSAAPELPCGPNADDRYCERYWELSAERDRLRSECDDYPELTADRDRLRELLDEIGTLAANAPEDDAFAVCEDIAMRIAAIDVPDDGRHPDGCTCQFCREDEREERDREELDDDIDNTIPDTERGDL